PTLTRSATALSLHDALPISSLLYTGGTTHSPLMLIAPYSFPSSDTTAMPSLNPNARSYLCSILSSPVLLIYPHLPYLYTLARPSSEKLNAESKSVGMTNSPDESI